MIHIEKDQPIPDSETLKVATATGDYEDTALISFYDSSVSEEVAGSFQAQFIKYGSVIYKCNTPQELGEEILKLDPESTHTAASYVRMTRELLKQMTEGSLESDSLDKVLQEEQINTEEQRTEETETPEETADTEEETEQEIEAPIITPEDETSTSTPATSTPEVILPSDTSTTTPEVIIETPEEETASSTVEDIVSYAKRAIKKSVKGKIKKKLTG